MKSKALRKPIKLRSASSAKLHAMKSEKAPPALEWFKDKTTAQAISKFMPEVKSPEGIAGLVAGIGLDMGVPVPEWAKVASRRFWDSCGLNLIGESVTDIAPAELGKLVGLGEQFSPDRKSAMAVEFVDTLRRFLTQVAVEEGSPTEARDFFVGRAKAGATVERIRQPAQRTKVFLFIACAWLGVARCKSAGELHRWLVAAKVIVESTDPAETRKACRIIGLRFRDKAGRPSEKK